MNLSTDGQRPGERTMIILGLGLPRHTRPGEHSKRQRVAVDVGVEQKMGLGCHQINDPT